MGGDDSTHQRRAVFGREEYPEPRKRYGNALAEMVALWGAVWQADASAPPAVVPLHKEVHKYLRFQVIFSISKTPVEAQTDAAQPTMPG